MLICTACEHAFLPPLHAGELIVHQVLLFIPVERLPEPKLPKCRRRKRGPASLAGEEVEEDIEEEDVDGDVTEDRSRARVLWIRNLTRIQRQVGCGVQFVCAVNCVERSLYECTLFSLTPLPSPSFPLPPSSPSLSSLPLRFVWSEPSRPACASPAMFTCLPCRTSLRHPTPSSARLARMAKPQKQMCKELACRELLLALTSPSLVLTL